MITIGRMNEIIYEELLANKLVAPHIKGIEVSVVPGLLCDPDDELINDFGIARAVEGVRVGFVFPFGQNYLYYDIICDKAYDVDKFRKIISEIVDMIASQVNG